MVQVGRLVSADLYLTVHFRPFVSTWFQPTYSRRLFPNFDDPLFKSTFKVRVRAPKDASVYSNQELEAITELK